MSLVDEHDGDERHCASCDVRYVCKRTIDENNLFVSGWLMISIVVADEVSRCARFRTRVCLGGKGISR
jgi:hypothetical protein